MTKIHHSMGFPITVKQEEMARVLGYEDRTLPDRVLAILSGIEKTARSFIEPACAYRWLSRNDMKQSKYLSEIDEAILCLVTIGSRLEAAVDRHKQKGELSRALILDTYGSAAAEAAADSAEAIICQAAGKKGLRCSARFSPGYGEWDVAEQRWIIPALEGESLDVTLTEGCMMVPRKSITFAVTVGEDPVEMRNGDKCEECGMPNCRFRHKASTKE